MAWDNNKKKNLDVGEHSWNVFDCSKIRNIERSFRFSLPSLHKDKDTAVLLKYDFTCLYQLQKMIFFFGNTFDIHR